jgi:hypothetical protein
MNIVVDPNVSGAELWQHLLHRNLVILTTLRALAACKRSPARFPVTLGK